MSEQSNWRILLISDDTSSLEMLQTTLYRAGFRTIVAVDGAAGLRLARAEQPDLVIVDALLLEPDGRQVCESLRDDPVCSNILRVLLVDFYPTDTDLALERTSADDRAGLAHLLIPKLMAPEHLVRQVKRLLQAEDVPQEPVGPVVLVVDYHEDDRESLLETLREAGYRAFGAGSAGDGRLLVETLCPAMVVIAVGFPEERGLDLLKVIRQHHPEIACAVILDSDQQELARTALGIGGEAFLIKPVEPWYVTPFVEGCLERARLRELNKRLKARLRESLSRQMEQQQALHGQNEELAWVNRRLREVDAIRESLANMIVHDLKNPLGVLLGTIELIKMEMGGYLRPEHQDILAMGKAAGQQMLTLVNSILELQRLEEGKMPLQLEPVVLKSVLQISLSQAHPLFKAKGLRLKQDIPEGLPYVRADPVLLGRIFDNLLSNAIRYSPNQGAITIKAEVQNGEVLVYIQDTGQGVPANLQERIFEKFTQVEVRRDGERSGAGLGLAFCKLATEEQGGRIWVESGGESGSIFCFTLPLWEEAESGDR
jgi:signal transduction histidine kinase